MARPRKESQPLEPLSPTSVDTVMEDTASEWMQLAGPPAMETREELDPPKAGIAPPKLKNAPTKYMILERKLVSMNGHLIQLSPGDIVSADSYGTNGIANLLASGLKMQELD